MPGPLSHSEIVYARQLPIFQHGFSILLIFEKSHQGSCLD
jgi:hypothetical protein